ncbi:hypothetical protein [Hymenobacter artigasi]
MRLEDADAEQKAWEDLCAWVQQHAKFIRISQVALMAGMSVEMAQALLLRDRDKTRIPRTSQRLEALLDVFTRPPFGYVSHVHEEK